MIQKPGMCSWTQMGPSLLIRAPVPPSTTVTVLGDARPPAKTQWPSAWSCSLKTSIAAGGEVVVPKQHRKQVLRHRDHLLSSGGRRRSASHACYESRCLDPSRATEVFQGSRTPRGAADDRTDPPAAGSDRGFVTPWPSSPRPAGPLSSTLPGQVEEVRRLILGPLTEAEAKQTATIGKRTQSPAITTTAIGGWWVKASGCQRSTVSGAPSHVDL